MLWILQRAARRSGLFPILPPPIPEHLSSLLAYDRPIDITGIGWHAVRFKEPLITSVDLDQPVIIAVSRHSNPERSWAFRRPDDRTPLVSDHNFWQTKLVPGNPFACSGEPVRVRFDLSAFDDLGLLRR
jgi:hypothetical protein